MSHSETKQFNFTLEQLASLVTKQDILNTYIHPEWKEQEFDWNTAIIDECQEIAGHLGWKWWKEGYKVGMTEANKKQIQLEVIDILHFIISLDVQEGVFELVMLAELNKPRVIKHSVETVNEWMRCDAANGVVTLGMWAELAHSVGLTEQDILETYVQKYVLNKFRQDNGYKDGSYVKNWEVTFSLIVEDNKVLERVVHQWGVAGKNTTDELALYTELERRYNMRLNK